MIVVTDWELGITRVSRWIFNCYVIHDGGDGRPVVVDPGLVSTSRRALQFVAEGLGADPTAVGSLVATHGHSDHVAGAAEAHDLTGADLHLPSRVERYLSGEEPRTPGPRQVARIWPVAVDQPFDAGSLRELARIAPDAGYGRQPMTMPFDPGRYLHDGEAVPGAPDWTVVAAPGHTDDATVFHRPATNTLLSGDSVLGADGRAWFNPEFVDGPASQTTTERLLELDVDQVFPGHGRPVRDRDVLRRARRHTETGLGGAGAGARAWARWLTGRAGHRP